MVFFFSFFSFLCLILYEWCPVLFISLLTGQLYVCSRRGGKEAPMCQQILVSLCSTQLKSHFVIDNMPLYHPSHSISIRNKYMLEYLKILKFSLLFFFMKKFIVSIKKIIFLNIQIFIRFL